MRWCWLEIPKRRCYPLPPAVHVLSSRQGLIRALQDDTNGRSWVRCYSLDRVMMHRIRCPKRFALAGLWRRAERCGHGQSTARSSDGLLSRSGRTLHTRAGADRCPLCVRVSRACGCAPSGWPGRCDFSRVAADRANPAEIALGLARAIIWKAVAAQGPEYTHLDTSGWRPSPQDGPAPDEVRTKNTSCAECDDVGICRIHHD